MFKKKTHQTESTETKKYNKVKTLLHGINSRLDTEEGTITDPEEREIQFVHTEGHTEKKKN